MDNQNQVNPIQPPVAQPLQAQPGPQAPPAMTPRQQIASRIKQANNVLVTVKASPSVDELAACIGLTLILNKMGKHATAVFSGPVPSTIEFLQPEKTLEKNTDSLRDFIIALDKSKADKLRYKVEDKVVKIFITPYRTSISEKDLEFSQGDLNVDVVVALGVRQQQDLDQAITAHGRILHDATIMSINNTPEQINLGTINWQDTTVSSLSELVTILSSDLGGRELLDSQTATSLLTGIVAVTKRFSNEKTSPQTMSASATLMAAGANQQLVATKLEPPPPPPPPIASSPPTPSPAAMIPLPAPVSPPPANDGTLTIDHGEKKAEEPPDDGLTEEERLEQIRIDNQGTLHKMGDNNTEATLGAPSLDSGAAPHFMDQPPSSLAAAGGPVNGESDLDAPASLDLEDQNSLSLPTVSNLLSHDSPSASSTGDARQNETLEQIEEDVHSPHLNNSGSTLSDLGSAQNAVNSQPDSVLQPIQALGAQPLGAPLHTNDITDLGNPGLVTPSSDMPLPPSILGAPDGLQPGIGDAPSPPPVPPPMIPPVMPTNDNQNF